MSSPVVHRRHSAGDRAAWFGMKARLPLAIAMGAELSCTGGKTAAARLRLASRIFLCKIPPGKAPVSRMKIEGSFSARFGYALPGDVVREEAPPGFRHAVLALAEKDMMLTGSNLTRAVQLSLGASASGDPLADFNGTTARNLIETCPWWRVYDIAEGIFVAGKKTSSRSCPTTNSIKTI